MTLRKHIDDSEWLKIKVEITATVVAEIFRALVVSLLGLFSTVLEVPPGKERQLVPV